MIQSIKLFTPPLLCSSVTIYNTSQTGKADILKSLAMMTLIARTISLGDATKEKTTEPAKDGDKKMFGHLVVVLNKYELKPNPEISAALT